ncbi:MAG: adenosine kinase [Desulfatibacillum sp.]|nr:adenosine kinase [Desulfatibacillum sp.]
MDFAKKNGAGVIVGVGSALMDILGHEEHAFVEKAGGVLGGMVYVDGNHIDSLLPSFATPPQVVPGGSACNTVVGVASLGGAGRFVGKAGNDHLGNQFIQGLEKYNVQPSVIRSGEPTGRVLSIVTPDAQRSMLTFLGASSSLDPLEVGADVFEDASVVLVEGYLLFNRDLITTALVNAKKSGAKVCLDLAAFTVVEHARDFLEDLVEKYVDILIANEDEAKAYTGLDNEEAALRKLAEKSEIGVLKVGERGSYILNQGQMTRVQPQTGGAVRDTTGAGDLWASGFLYGLVNDFSMEKSGRLGSACGHEVCQVMGAGIPEEGWRRIRALLD